MLCRGALRHRYPFRKPLFMRVCRLSVSILPTVCPQEFLAHRLSLHLFLWSYYSTFCRIVQEKIIKHVLQMENKDRYEVFRFEDVECRHFCVVS